jgi:hypothetical protein
LHFLVRFLGLTGFLVACVGLVMAGLEGLLGSWRGAYDKAYAAVTTYQAAVPTWLVLGGATAALLALAVEALVVAGFVAGRRSAFGFNAVVQVALAAALLVGINVFSFGHFLRFDWTRSGEFTLPQAVKSDLEKLDPAAETTVVVYQRHKTFGGLTDKPDRYDYAAERKVVEKLRDLVEQFRELGGRFNVQVLDVEEEGFDDKLNALAPRGSKLRSAIDAAPENSVFLSTRTAVTNWGTSAVDAWSAMAQAQLGQSLVSGPAPYLLGVADGLVRTPRIEHVQQLSFNELFLLDRPQSIQDNGGRGNLVLLAQGTPWRAGLPVSGRGIEPFARKILNLEARKPRVGVLVMHPLLTTTGSEDAFTLAGLRKSLEAHGFEVRDVVLRRFGEFGSPEPAADTPQESELDEIDADLEDVESDLKAIGTAIKQETAVIDEWTLKPGEKEEDKLAALSKKYARQLGGRRLTAEHREAFLGRFKAELAGFRELLDAKQKERDAVLKRRAALNVDALRELKREKDVKAKLDRALADCDLLLIPRLTRRINGSLAAPYRFHKLSEAQLASIKEFLSRGKPLLACLGPSTEPTELNLPPESEPDSLDTLLSELGVRLSKHTVLFDTDSKAFADRRLNPFQVNDAVKPPPLDFEATPDEWRGLWTMPGGAVEMPINPIRGGLRVMAHSVGAGSDPGQTLDITIRFPRPVYFEAPKGFTPAFEPTFLVTAPGWTDDRPYPVRGHKPHYEPTAPDDPTAGTFDQKRRGKFPVGIVVETPLPSAWTSYPRKDARVAVIGQGDVFVGSELPPAKEQLLLQTTNWLLTRDDALPRADHPWSYPRVSLTPGSRDEQLWQWGTRLGLPVLFAYLGLVVLLVRRLR